MINDSIIITVFFCIVIADMITGFVHWVEDTYGTPDWPILGKHVVEPNILHHEHPDWIGYMSSLVGRNYQTMTPAIIVMVIIWYSYGWFAWPVLLTVGLASMGNEVHTWNHRTKNNKLISFFQDAAIIQTRQQHNKHHKKPYDKYYCTLTNFVNPVLETIYFWRSLEWLLSCINIKIQRGSVWRKGY